MIWKPSWRPFPRVQRDEGCVFSAEAKAGLREIALFIAGGNNERALSFVRVLRARAQQLGDTPRAFPLVPRCEHQGIRRRPFGDYLIFYRVDVPRRG